MKAIVQTEYGSEPETLTLQEIDRPQVGPGEVLVRVKASSIHIGDWHVMRGMPYAIRPVFGLRRPRNRVPGTDFSGIVAETGTGVTDLRPGDEVFGWGTGAWAEFAVAKAENFLKKPIELSFEEASAVGVSAQTALQALRDHAKIQPGQKVLINGASGGVGSFAVQIARSLGAEVTAVCSTGNVANARTLGATHVIDYTAQSFIDLNERYDVIVDIAGNHSLATLRGALSDDGRVLPVGSPVDGWFGGIGHVVKALGQSLIHRQQLRPFVSVNKRETLADLTDLIQAGELTPVIDRTYPLAEAGDAMVYVGEGHAKGKVIITA